MPVVAIVGAVASAAAGVKAVAAGSALIGGLQIAAGVMTGLGVVTKNPKLTKLGAVLGLGTAVAGAATSAGKGLSTAEAAAGVARKTIPQGAARVAATASEVDGMLSGWTTSAAPSAASAATSATSGVGYGLLGRANAATTNVPGLSMPVETVQAGTGLRASIPQAAPVAPAPALTAPALQNLQSIEQTGLLGRMTNYLRDHPENARLLAGSAEGLSNQLLRERELDHAEQLAAERRAHEERLIAERRARLNQSILGQRAI